MNSLIPVELYYKVYINLCLFVVIFTVLHTLILEKDDFNNIKFINIIGYISLIFLILYIGQRPIHGEFGDTVNYNKSYVAYVHGASIDRANDLGWHLFMKFMAQFVSVHTFFTICSFLYIFPLYKISKKFFDEYWYYCFIMFVVSFSFWTYSVNGVRNGVACSLFLWAISSKENKFLMYTLFLIALSFHKTVSLPIIAYGITYLYNKPKTYFKIWLACIPLSFVIGGVLSIILANLGFGDDRLSSYLTSTQESSGGRFRWDFLFHSSFALASGYYFIVKKEFNDPNYFRLLNTYLICNSFWVLIIKANYSNRFAYLSWFMMAIVVIYPFIKQNFFKDNHAVLGKVIFAYFSFTYLMYYLYY